MDWDSFVEEAYAYLSEHIDDAMERYHLGDYEEYVVDQETSTIHFMKAGKSEITADIQIVGSISSTSHTWMWAWANSHVIDSAKKNIEQLKIYGEENNYAKMIEDQWPADEVDGWAMTAIAAYLLKTQGAYRVPTEMGFVYMILSNIRADAH